MRSSRTSRTWVLAGLLCALGARAQTPVEGFDAERFFPSAPGAGWFVMDSLDMQGRLGGVLSFSSRYARDPLRVGGTAVVTDSAYGQVAGAVTLGAWRFSASFDFPFAVKGRTVTIGGYGYTGPDVDLGSSPDTISDVRVGVDVRLFGEATGPLRLGLGAQLWIPSGRAEEYVTDGTYRGMVRVPFAGDVGWLTYAGHVGVHIRPRDDGGVPGAPRGSELLFGAAAGAKLPLGEASRAVLGPEVYGATAFNSFLKSETTSAEALLSGRWETNGETGTRLRVKLGAGLGLGSSFGTPAWRVVFAIEVIGQTSEAVRVTEATPGSEGRPQR
jgi:OmpA-OmpF porin, OOP family